MTEQNRKVWALIHCCALGAPHDMISKRVAAIDAFMNRYRADELPNVQDILAAVPRAREIRLGLLLDQAERLLAIAGIAKLPALATSDELALTAPEKPARKARA